MFDEFVNQVKKLFSSKSNRGKLVNIYTDRLHFYKQVLLAFCIILLLGYSNFREHFKCAGQGKVDSKTVTHFCWINGTTTVIKKNVQTVRAPIPIKTEGDKFARLGKVLEKLKQDQLAAYRYQPSNGNQESSKSRSLPHVGTGFIVNRSEQEIINHNYMRSIWAVLIMMAICSYIAQRQWSAIFNNDILVALLKLPGYEELSLVKKAQEVRCYELLTKLEREGIKKAKESHSLYEIIKLIDGQDNECNHLLDYYPNQLLYTLLSGKQLTNLKFKLIKYSLVSTILTLLQFLLPLHFIGMEYLLYGWNYLVAWCQYTIKQLKNEDSHKELNSVDYALSGRIFPLITQCEYRQFGLIGEESFVVRCMVPINEISGKIYAVLWWFICINIVIELYFLLQSLLCLHHKIAKFWFLPRSFRGDGESVAKLMQFIDAKSHGYLDSKGMENSKALYQVIERDSKLPDPHIYYLLYFIYLRLNGSERKTKQVIQMTNDALKRYSDNMDKLKLACDEKPQH